MRYDGRMKFHSWYSSPAVVSICKYCEARVYGPLPRLLFGGIGTWPEEGAPESYKNSFAVWYKLTLCLP